MWQEARKQEKVIRGIMVDHKRRAEKRKTYYDKIKKDPAEFLQVWGRKSIIHIDPAIAEAADNPSIMTKWSGDPDVIIDRFDARSHLDHYEEYISELDKNDSKTEAEKKEEKMLNYERYRTLILNESIGCTEQDCLKQIEQDEKLGGLNDKTDKKNAKSNAPKAQIGYNYETKTGGKKREIESEESESDEPDDLDMLDIKNLSSENKRILNKYACEYGMEFGDFVRLILLECEEKEELKKEKELEAERAQLSGRKSRRERRLAKEKRLRERGFAEYPNCSDPASLSYSLIEKDKSGGEKDSDESDGKHSTSSRGSSRRRYRRRSRSGSPNRRRRRSKSRSKSPKSPPAPSRVMFITSFGIGREDKEAESNAVQPATSILSSSNQTAAAPLFKQSQNSIRKLKQTLSSNRSRSTSPILETKKVVQLPTVRRDTKKKDSESSSSETGNDEEKVLKKYMKRRQKRAHETASDEELEEKETKASTSKATKSTEPVPHFKILQEKLKKKMQKQIEKELKKDQKLEQERRRKEYEERKEREAQLNQINQKVKENKKRERRKFRQLYGLPDEPSSRSSSSSRSRSSSPSGKSGARRGRSSRSRSRSRGRRRDKSHSPYRTYKRSKSRGRSTSSSSSGRWSDR